MSFWLSRRREAQSRFDVAPNAWRRMRISVRFFSYIFFIFAKRVTNQVPRGAKRRVSRRTCAQVCVSYGLASWKFWSPHKDSLGGEDSFLSYSVVLTFWSCTMSTVQLVSGTNDPQTFHTQIFSNNEVLIHSQCYQRIDNNFSVTRARGLHGENIRPSSWLARTAKTEAWYFLRADRASELLSVKSRDLIGCFAVRNPPIGPLELQGERHRSIHPASSPRIPWTSLIEVL